MRKIGWVDGDLFFREETEIFSFVVVDEMYPFGVLSEVKTSCTR